MGWECGPPRKERSIFHVYKFNFCLNLPCDVCGASVEGVTAHVTKWGTRHRRRRGPRDVREAPTSAARLNGFSLQASASQQPQPLSVSTVAASSDGGDLALPRL